MFLCVIIDASQDLYPGKSSFNPPVENGVFISLVKIKLTEFNCVFIDSYHQVGM